MQCTTHPKTNAAGICTVCGNPFCSDCLLKVKRKNICVDCASQRLSGKGRGGTSTPAVFQQQQQQDLTVVGQKREVPTSNASINDIIKWCVAAFMVLLALGQFASSKVFSGLVLLLLGVYWIPPITIEIHKIVKEKWNVALPRWARVALSLFLFFVAMLLPF
jgi:hypothetical protein